MAHVRSRQRTCKGRIRLEHHFHKYRRACGRSILACLIASSAHGSGGSRTARPTEAEAGLLSFRGSSRVNYPVQCYRSRLFEPGGHGLYCCCMKILSLQMGDSGNRAASPTHPVVCHNPWAPCGWVVSLLLVHGGNRMAPTTDNNLRSSTAMVGCKGKFISFSIRSHDEGAESSLRCWPLLWPF
jgi:hypothetical protein